MRRRKTFGSIGITTLAAVLAALVSACHNPVPGDFAGTITSVHINRTVISLPVVPRDRWVSDYTLVVTLRPSIAHEGASIEWETSNPAVADFFEEPSAVFGANGRAQAKIVVYPYIENIAYIRARVTSDDGRVFYAWCMVVVMNEDEDGGENGPGPDPENEPTEPESEGESEPQDP